MNGTFVATNQPCQLLTGPVLSDYRFAEKIAESDMAKQNKIIKKSIRRLLRENEFSLKSLHRQVKDELKSRGVDITKEEFKKIVDVLVSKGSITQVGKLYNAPKFNESAINNNKDHNHIDDTSNGDNLIGDNDAENLGEIVSDQLKRRKFSKTETQLLLQATYDFVEENGMQVSELCRGMRENTAIKKVLSGKARGFWKDLAQLLPHREMRSIYRHVERQLMRQIKVKASFTEEEKRLLMYHVKTRGQKWAEIGRDLNKLDDDCKLTYVQIMEKRSITGHFGIEEDAALLRSVQRRTKTQGQSVADIPLRNLPWIDIIKDMGYRRSRLDYLRRWDTLRSNLLYGHGLERVENTNVDSSVKLIRSRSQKSTMNALMAQLRSKSLVVLEALLALDVSDESEVIWADIDRKFGFRHAEASRRWKVLCKECPSSVVEESFTDKLEYLVNKYKLTTDLPVEPDVTKSLQTISTVEKALERGSSSGARKRNEAVKGFIEGDDDEGTIIRATESDVDLDEDFVVDDSHNTHLRRGNGDSALDCDVCNIPDGSTKKSLLITTGETVSRINTSECQSARNMKIENHIQRTEVSLPAESFVSDKCQDDHIDGVELFNSFKNKKKKSKP